MSAPDRAARPRLVGSPAGGGRILVLATMVTSAAVPGLLGIHNRVGPAGALGEPDLYFVAFLVLLTPPLFLLSRWLFARALRPLVFQLAGMVWGHLAAAAGLLVTHSYLGYSPSLLSTPREAFEAWVALLGIVPASCGGWFCGWLAAASGLLLGRTLSAHD